MNGKLVVKNWSRYQHYKDRCPPWIKLATDTFQNYEFSRLQDASKLLAICIWTLAARSRDGSVPDDFEYIKSQGALGSTVKPDHLKELINQGFVERASEVLADCKQTACSETEGEGETERETEKNICAETAKPSSAPDEAVLVFPCDGPSPRWPLTRSQIERWQSQFPALRVSDECSAALAWIEANPQRRKTARGMPSFLASWLGRAQNRPRIVASPSQAPAIANGARPGEKPWQAAERIAREQQERAREESDERVRTALRGLK